MIFFYIISDTFTFDKVNGLFFFNAGQDQILNGVDFVAHSQLLHA